MRAVIRSFAVMLALTTALCCMAACSSLDNDASSSGSGSGKAEPTSSESFADEAPLYETEYFSVELPPSWGNAWSVDLGQEYRSSMEATNYSYAFTFDGTPQFTIECKLFSLNADAAIGSTGTRQVEFYASDDISPENEFYVREHIEVKQDTPVPEEPAESTESGPLSGGSTSSETDLLSGPVKDETEALNRVHDCLMRAGKEIPPKIEFDHMTDSGRYVIHGYEIVNSGVFHTATWFWYSVGEDGSIYDELSNCEIDPLTMEAAATSDDWSNPYYKVSLPPELSGADVSYEEGSFGGPTTVGAMTTVMMDGELLFDVVCLSDDWGPQGDMAIMKIGTPSSDPSSVVYLTVPVWQTNDYAHDRDVAEAKAREYVSYVTLL